MSKYVVFDGMDGCGKGTQIDLLKAELDNSAVFTREPGGTLLAEEIRKLGRDNPLASESTALFKFLLFWAAREDLEYKLVFPALQSGKHVFSDRGDSSTHAFQMNGEEHKELFHLFHLIRRHVFLNRRPPDLYIVFDLPAEMSRERAMQDATRKTTHFDIRDLAFYERVREGFREFAERASVVFIDATGSPKEVHALVCAALAEVGISLSK